MKTINTYCGNAIIGLVLAFSIPVVAGCSNGKVPDSNPDEIESAKFDAEKAENPNPLGASIPPD